MRPVTVLFAPVVDVALLEFIDHVDVDSIPTVLDFLERIQTRLVDTLSTLPQPSDQQEAVPVQGICSHG